MAVWVFPLSGERENTDKFFRMNRGFYAPAITTDTVWRNRFGSATSMCCYGWQRRHGECAFFIFMRQEAIDVMKILAVVGIVGFVLFSFVMYCLLRAGAQADRWMEEHSSYPEHDRKGGTDA